MKLNVIIAIDGNPLIFAQEVTYPSFTSASKKINSYDVDMPFKVHYKITAYNAKETSSIGLTSENEVIFKTDIAYRITNTRLIDNEFYILCEEVKEYETTDTDNKYGAENAHLQSDQGQTVQNEHKELASGTSFVSGRSSSVSGLYEEQSGIDRKAGTVQNGRNNNRNDDEVGAYRIRQGQILSDAADRQLQDLQRERAARGSAKRLELSLEDRLKTYPNYGKGAILRKK